MWKPSQKFWLDREALHVVGEGDVLSEIQEALTEVPEVRGRLPRDSGGVRRLCRWSGSGLELLPVV